MRRGFAVYAWTRPHVAGKRWTAKSLDEALSRVREAVEMGAVLIEIEVWERRRGENSG